jgi:nucleolar MIF4G domain-containing protein 1
MPSTSVAELQQKLFKRIGIDAPVQNPNQKTFERKQGSKPTTRKEQRKAQRVEKKANRYQRPANQPPKRPARPVPSSRLGKPYKPSHGTVNKTSNRPAEWESRHITDESGTDEPTRDESDQFSDFDDEEEDDDDLAEDSDFDSINSAPNATKSRNGIQDTTTNISKAAQDRLAEDDAEIDAFERKLGIKKGRKSLPQAFKDDGLDELLGDFGGESDGGEDLDTKKRKRDYDDWLSSKRKKVDVSKVSRLGRQADEDGDSSASEGYGTEEGGLDESADETDDDKFSGFDSDQGEAVRQPPRRENPYVAPTEGAVVAKYVPPSLRKAAGSESEQRTRLQRSIQGQVNRLTDANILSIVQAIEELYQKNARGDVTEIVTDIILAQVCKPEYLPDQFFVLTGGFTAALYKIIGSSFGSHIVRRVVEELANDYEKADKNAPGEAGIRKEACNLVNFLAQLYVFEVVSCRIIFDYMERFLVELSELNVELLLRICRMAGRLLRRDDPQALKHISGTLNRNLSKQGSDSVSVRTKFMVETINDLKNSKPKGKGLDSAIVSEHVIRMRKRIGELKSQSRRLDGLAPMGVSLQDIEGADTKGKWWLVGASVPVKSQSKSQNSAAALSDTGDEATDDEDMDFVLPDYPQKARSQGFSSTAQIAIFSALMSATDYEHAYRQYLNLKLKKDDQLEIARVLVQCVGSEAEYNEFYALVATQACSNSRLRFAFQDRLWKIFRGLGESLFGEEAEDEETADSERMKDPRRMANVARFYAALVADRSLTISVLKPLDLPELNPLALEFIECFTVSLLGHCKGKGDAEDDNITRVFGAARETPSVAAGIHWLLRKKIRKSKLMGGKDGKKLERVRQKAQAAVQAVATAV